MMKLCGACGMGGWTNERPQTDHVIRGPKRGLNKKLNLKGTNKRQTLRLLDQLGPVGRFREKIVEVGQPIYY